MPDKPKIGCRSISHEPSTKEIDWDMLAHALAADYMNKRNERIANEKKTIKEKG